MSQAAPPRKVIDLTAGARVRVERDDNPFSSMGPLERRRILVRVLCELVAYGELEPSPSGAGPARPTTRR